MTIRLEGSTSGYAEIDAPAVAGNNTLVLPATNGTADQALVTNGSGTLSFADRGRMVVETAKTATGTSVDFTGIPSWVKRVTMMFNGVSTNGLTAVLVQLGTSSGFETTNYFTQATAISGSTASSSLYANGLPLVATTTGAYRCGSYTFSLMGSNTWSYSGITGDNLLGSTAHIAGVKQTSGTLDRIRITTGNGTDTFDAGSINILYEG